MIRILKQRAGILIVEVILAIAVFVFFASGAIYFLAANVLTAQTVERRAQAQAYLQEGVEAVQSIDRVAWNYLADSPDAEPGDGYGLALVDGVWTLASEPDHPDDNPAFTRTITIADVYRNSTGEIAPSDANDVAFDPHTRQITVTITWTARANRTTTVVASVYVTDWDADAVTEDTLSDWAGGTLDNLRISNSDDGELQIIQATMELDTITVGANWQTVALDNEYDQAVVVASLLDGNNPQSPVATRVRDVTANSFDVRLIFPEDNFSPSSSRSETVQYLVIEAGQWTLGDGATQIEAGIVPEVARVNCRTCGSWNNGTDVLFEHSYASKPIVFHQVVTENDRRWITSFASDDTSQNDPPGTDGFQVALNGAEVTTVHDPEDIAYVVFAGEAADTFEGVSFETDRTGLNLRGYTEPHYTEPLDQTYGAAPWVAVTQLSMRNTDGSWPMLDTITPTEITLYVDEDQTFDAERSHPTEYGGYVAFASTGTYYLDDAAAIYDAPPFEVGKITSTATGHMEVGTSTATTNWSTITLTQTYTKPVVVASMLDGNNPDSPMTVRVRNAISTSFDVRLDFPPDNFPPTSTNAETIYYLVVEAGVWTVGDDNTRLEANIVEDVARVNCSTCGSWNAGIDKAFRQTYPASPVVLHQVMSEHDASWITSFVSDDTSATLVPGTDGFQVALNGAEVTNTHEPEDIGYVVMTAEMSDMANDIAFETDGTGDVVRGYSNTHRTETFDQSYGAPPLVLTAQLAQDSIEGSWAMLDAISATSVTLYVDEDQTADGERSHGTEDVVYAAFATAGDFILHDQTFLDQPVTVNLQNTYLQPVVITTPYFTNDTFSPASIRVYDVMSNRFTAKLDVPDDNFAPRNTTFSDDIYYFVIEAGQWQIGDMLIEAEIDTISTVGSDTDGYTGTVTPFQHHYDDPPVVLHQVMSNHDANWITSFVTRTNDTNQPPTAINFSLGLNAAQVTPSKIHAAEEVGWLAFSDIGTGTVADHEFRTVRADEFAGGHSQGCFEYTHGGNYAEPLVLASQMSMDGSDGSWATICDVTSTSVGVHVEEDQYTDADRGHDHEAAGFIIFPEEFAFAGEVNISNRISGTYTSAVLGNENVRNFNIAEWTEQIACPNCQIQLQLRTGDTPEAVAEADYVGPDGSGATSFSPGSGDVLALQHIGKPFLQYFMILHGTTADSPILEDVTFSTYEQ